VIAISEAVNRYMAGPGLGINPARLHTIHYGIDARPFCEAPREAGLALRERWGVPERALLVGFAGRLVPQKAIDTLLEGFARYRQQSPLDPWLAIVGAGPLEMSLRRQAEQLGISSRVCWPGFHDDMPAVMRSFDIFALTSVYEGFGLVLAEAMASRLPVVATRVGAIPEIVLGGETGLLVQPREPQELAAALHQLGSDEVRRRLGEAGQRRVLQEFTLERMCRETDELYRRLCVPSGRNAARGRVRHSTSATTASYPV
jgi:glycosyltransferase involved in cell wall biosynthesis